MAKTPKDIARGEVIIITPELPIMGGRNIPIPPKMPTQSTPTAPPPEKK